MPALTFFGLSPVFWLLLSAGALALAGGGAVFFLQRYVSPEPGFVELRLAKLKGLRTQEAALTPGKTNVSRYLKGSHYANESLGKRLEQFTFTASLKKKLQKSGVSVHVDRFMLLYVLMPLLALLMVGLATQNVGFLLAGLMAPALPFIYLNIQIKKRSNRITAQLPDALNLMTTSLRAGHSLQSSMSVVSTELSEPISLEFRQVINDVSLGIPFKDALEKMVLRLDTVADIRMFSTAILIQRESGGNLAEILDKLSLTIRERFKLRGQIQALTGQSRLTGYCLGAAPLVMALILTLFFPAYIKPLYDTDVGHMALIVAFLMQIAGFVVIKKIIDIRV